MKKRAYGLGEGRGVNALEVEVGTATWRRDEVRECYIRVNDFGGGTVLDITMQMGG